MEYVLMVILLAAVLYLLHPQRTRIRGKPSEPLGEPQEPPRLNIKRPKTVYRDFGWTEEEVVLRYMSKGGYEGPKDFSPPTYLQKPLPPPNLVFKKGKWVQAEQDNLCRCKCYCGKGQ